jgi:hypothetical protein
MSTNRPSKKKGGVPAPKKQGAETSSVKKEIPANRPVARPVAPEVANRTTVSVPRIAREKKPLVFNTINIYLIIASASLMIIGTALMSGGAMTDPNVWDEGVIYSSRRLTLAPIVMLIGLATGIVAIFKK